MAETADHTEEYINPDAAFHPLPPSPDAKYETIIQPKVEHIVVGDVLDGDEDPDEDATNDNKNVNNSIPDDGEMENDDGEVFHPSKP